MQRVIVAPAELSGTALSELKHWLALTTPREDAALMQLLRASLATCEAFIRQVPIETGYEELHPAQAGWQALGLGPVRAITGIDAVASDGTRTPVAANQFLLDLTSDATGRFRLLGATGAAQLAVHYTAGIAADWDALPEALAHGVLRLAAHNFRAREDDAGTMPPAAVAALWQPLRRMRIV